MKIAIPAEENRMGSPVSLSFGRTAYYAIVDSKTLEYSFIENPGAQSQGGAGIKAAQTVVDSGAEAVITFHLGQNAADVLKPAGVTILKAVPGNVTDLVRKYVAGVLEELTEIHAGYHNGGA